MISKNMISSPLSCCNPSGDRNGLNPVFKQQYVAEGGKMKMTVPLSPMHYLTNANVYLHDERFPMRMDQGFSQFNERLHHNSRNFDYEHKNDVTKRIITPSVSFITQPRRNMSAQFVDRTQINTPDINLVLKSIDEKLARIEFLCKNNDDEIKEIISILKPKAKVEFDLDVGKTRLVAKEKNEQVYTKITEYKGQDDEKRSKPVENTLNDNVRKHNIKYKEHEVSGQKKESPRDRGFTHLTLMNKAPQINANLEERLIDSGEDLKRSNDVLENYIRSVKFDSIPGLENRLDVLTSDYASVKVANNLEKLDSPKAVNDEDSMLSNIEIKIKKLFSKLDQEQNVSEPVQPTQVNDSLALFNPHKQLNKPEKTRGMNFPVKALTPDYEEESHVQFQLAKPDFHTSHKDQGDMEVKLVNQDLNPSKPTTINEPTMKFTGVEMMNLLEGLDLSKMMRDVSLTEEEVKFLRSLNKNSEVPPTNAHPPAPSPHTSQSSKSDSGDSEPFKCDLFPPTRTDFTSLLAEDSIRGLNSTIFD